MLRQTVPSVSVRRVEEKERHKAFSKSRRKKSVKKHLEFFTETEREEDLDGGRCLSRHRTVTETLLQTGSVQSRGIERCPKSIYDLNTDNTGEQKSDGWNLTSLQQNKQTKTKNTTLSKSIVFRRQQILPLLCQI